MRIMVVDGQGGGIGGLVIKKIREELGHSLTIYAVGTNAMATAQMMKSGANKGATGEGAVRWAALRSDLIVGPVAIVLPNAMMGELTPAMAESICSSSARKLLLPLTQENLKIVGFPDAPLPHLVDEVLKLIKEENSHV